MAVAFTQDGKQLASASEEGRVNVWKPESDPRFLTHQSTYLIHLKSVTSAAFSPDCKTLACGSAEGTVNLWRLPETEKADKGGQSEETLPSVAISTESRKVSLLVSAVGQVGGLPNPWQAGWTAGTILNAFRGRVLRLNNRDHVQLAKTEGLIDLNGSFTVEMWVRTYAGTNYLVGDESWPNVGPPLAPNIRTAGWIFRIDDDRSFSVAIGTTTGMWWEVRGQLPPSSLDWDHFAVVKTMKELRIFRNGKLVANKTVKGEKFVPTPGDLFLGVRKDGNADRKVNAEIRAFRITKAPIYQQEFTPAPILGKTPETQVLLDLSAGHARVLSDQSGNNHHGTIAGGKWVDSD
jgi:hypothetical protein